MSEMLAVDIEELEAALRPLRQGDILDVAKIVVLYSPDAPQYAEEVEGVPSEEPVMTRETLIRPGLVGIVSGTCDLRRLPADEPYVLVSPLARVDQATYELAVRGQSSRLFAYPPIPDVEEERLVLDLRIVDPIEKAAFASSHIHKIQAPLSEPQREDLRRFLAARLGRPAFPDEVYRQVVQPTERALKQLASQDPVQGFLDSVCFIGLRWTPGKPYCTLLLLTDPSKRVANNVNEPELSGADTRLTKALNHFTREGDYTVTVKIRDVTETSAVELLECEELQLDVDLAD